MSNLDVSDINADLEVYFYAVYSQIIEDFIDPTSKMNQERNALPQFEACVQEAYINQSDYKDKQQLLLEQASEFLLNPHILTYIVERIKTKYDELQEHGMDASITFLAFAVVLSHEFTQFESSEGRAAFMDRALEILKKDASTGKDKELDPLTIAIDDLKKLISPTIESQPHKRSKPEQDPQDQASRAATIKYARFALGLLEEYKKDKQQPRPRRPGN